MNKLLYDSITRMLDIFFSGMALIVFSPLFMVVIVILKFTGEGEVFYLQERIGRYSRSFKLIKFATMLKNSANIGTGELTLPNDVRVLLFGKFLRKTKINELPQLINVFIGNMSVIGPRPQTEKYYYKYLEEDRKYISKVRPGLSGLGSVVFRDEEEILSNVSDPLLFDYEVITPYKGKLEKWFVENRSILLYFKLTILTILAVIIPNNILYKKYFRSIPKPSNELEKFLN